MSNTQPAAPDPDAIATQLAQTFATLDRVERDIRELHTTIAPRIDELAREIARLKLTIANEIVGAGFTNQLATRDQVTGLYSRAEMVNILNEELARYRRTHRTMTLVLVEIDGFGELINERGLAVANIVLQRFGHLIRENVRLLDRTARHIGAQVAVISPETSESGAFQMVERIRQTISERPLVITATEIALALPITACFGIAGVPAAASTDETLIEAAERALAAAQRRGANQTVINFGRLE